MALAAQYPGCDQLGCASSGISNHHIHDFREDAHGAADHEVAAVEPEHAADTTAAEGSTAQI